jgi:cation diffusion facilitator family transporter
MKALGRRPELVALASVFIGVALVVGKLVVGVLTGSLGILSEAAHSILDVVASFFALAAVRTARKPADIEHPYGHGRAENVAAFAEGVVMIITALGIAFEAVRRLTSGGGTVNPAGYAFALLIGTLLIEAGRAGVLRGVGRAADSEALQADATNRLADVLATVAVLIGLVGVTIGLPWADSVAALVVAVIIARAAINIAWRSGDILMDRRGKAAARCHPGRRRGARGEVRSGEAIGPKPDWGRRHRHRPHAVAGGCRGARRRGQASGQGSAAISRPDSHCRRAEPSERPRGEGARGSGSKWRGT